MEKQWDCFFILFLISILLTDLFERGEEEAEEQNRNVRKKKKSIEK